MGFPWDSHGIPIPILNPIPMHISTSHRGTFDIISRRLLKNNTVAWQLRLHETKALFIANELNRTASSVRFRHFLHSLTVMRHRSSSWRRSRNSVCYCNSVVKSSAYGSRSFSVSGPSAHSNVLYIPDCLGIQVLPIDFLT